MDYLRQGIGLRGYAQKNPIQEYKRESFEMFTSMLEGINYEVVQALTRVQIKGEEQVDQLEQQQSQAAEQNLTMKHEAAASALSANQAEENSAQPFVRDQPKLGRNDPCWCGSGKKFKHCHGKLS